ncbi:hypothetical protein R3P38DRAFT_2779644 [Favolaschia claudopus]|uniref:Uncharacterized protein n=1 Tax=Favolaschia claudopus TaxID=2862362 RepID=A0AAW0BE91_9AGAR
MSPVFERLLVPSSHNPDRHRHRRRRANAVAAVVRPLGASFEVFRSMLSRPGLRISRGYAPIVQLCQDYRRSKKESDMRLAAQRPPFYSNRLRLVDSEVTKKEPGPARNASKVDPKHRIVSALTWLHESRDRGILYQAFETHKSVLFDSSQTVVGLHQTMLKLLDLKSWTRVARPQTKLTQSVYRSTCGVARSRGPVQLKLFRFGANGPNQFAVFATEVIPEDSIIYQWVGQLSMDNVDGEAKKKSTQLSEMK